jgi:hypothetical protein
MVGRYGVGTLWCERTTDAFFLKFNARKIAKRALRGGAWEALEEGWKVTPCGMGKIQVQLNNSDGVVVSLTGGMGK